MSNKTLTILIGSYYLSEDEQYVNNTYYKSNICVANEQYEKRIINGFKESGENFVFLSCPRVGGWPKYSKKLFVKGFSENDYLKTVNYVSPYGLLNTFKAYAIRKRIKQLLKTIDENTLIHVIACEAHRPYLEGIKILKKRHKNTISTLIVPDLPIHMLKSKNILYRFLKKKDSSKIQKLCNSYVNSFLCFTEEINKTINCLMKPYVIFEGIVENYKIINTNKPLNKINCCFLGKTDERNGLKLIIDAAKIAPSNIVFNIYGSGDMDDELKNLKLNNLFYHGFVSPSLADDIVENSDIMLSPRFPNEDYVKYSFPSKIFEYLSLHKHIITFKLPCYFDQLDSVLYYPSDFTPESLVTKIVEVIEQWDSLNYDEIDRIINKYYCYNIVKNLIGLRERIDEQAK